MTASSSGPALIDHSEPPLSAPLTLSFDYTRSVGPTLSRFFTALRARRIVGVRGSDGRVHVPPVEYDPVTYEPLSEMVPVSSVGTVASWTWQPEPLAGQPLDRPFAWALIKLDGADTLLMHAVDVGTAGPSAIHTGARVHAHWADQPVGAITDIACFALGETAEPVAAHKTEDARDPVTMIVTPIQLEIQHTASHEESAYLRAIAQGKLVGARTGKTGKVYFPPHGADPATGKPTSEFVELPDKGTVASQMLWDPIRFDETCPSSDGACAVVVGDEEIADARLAQGHPVAWIHGTALRTEPLAFAGRDQVNPQAGRDAAAALWKAAGITSPIDEIDAAEIYVPFSWFEPMWLENLGFAREGEGWKLTEAGETAIGGRLPVNPSGGVLSANPIGASGLIRFAEAAIQVMGKAEARQVPGARKALGHAYGGGSQYFSMWVVGCEKPKQAAA